MHKLSATGVVTELKKIAPRYHLDVDVLDCSTGEVPDYLLSMVPDPSYWQIDLSGSLVKIFVKGVRARVLLEFDGRMRLYRHHDAEVTRRYRGRRLSAEWILRFMVANAERARKIIASHSEQPAKTAPIVLNYASRERRTVSCSCGGTNENCARCFGAGFYEMCGDALV